MSRRDYGAGIRARVRRLFTSIVYSDARLRREIDEELAAHIEARVEHLVARGAAPDAARAEALRRFGDINAGRAYLHAFARDQQRRLQLVDRMDELSQDIRYVLRSLARSPAFTAGVVATLALGLGINAAVFRVADQVLFRPPAGVANAHSVRRVESSVRFGSSAPIRGSTFSYLDVQAMFAGAPAAAAAIYSRPSVPPHTPDGREVPAMSVDSGYFHLLGVKPLAGRLFDAGETAPGADVPVAILSYDYWQGTLGGAPLHEQTTITLNDRIYHVVGIMPRGFIGIDLDPLDVWLPLGVGWFGRTEVNGVVIPWYQSDMGRPLRALVRLSATAADSVTATRLSAALGAKDADGGGSARSVVLHSIVPAGDPIKIESAVRLLERLSGVAMIILLIACANAANLLIARGLRRRQEIAVRLAMGASRVRIARLLLVESLALALAGGVAAVVAGYWTGEALRRMVFPDAHWTSGAFDERSILFIALLAIIAGLAAGVAPALQLSSPDLVTALKDVRGRGGRRTWVTRTALVVMQTAFSLVLLVASGLLVRSLGRLNGLRLGFDANGLVTASSSRALLRAMRPAEGDVSATRLAALLAHSPSVRGVALATTAPFGSISRMDMSVPGTTFVPEQNVAPSWAAVTPNYFGVMGTRVVRGRAFSDDDVRDGETVAIVNESMARHYWPAGIPFGSCILAHYLPCARVVGVVEDIRDTPGSDEPALRYYLSLTQLGDSASAVIVRAAPGAAPAVAASIKAMLPRDSRASISVVADRVAQAVRPWRVATLLFIALGGVALALACVGVYSVMSYVASERVHEIGVRMVLGATAGDVRRLMLRDGARLVVLGGLVGLAGAAAGARLLESLLFGVSPFDPLVYVAGFLCLGTIAVAATLAPAVRASRTDPAAALRSE